MRHRNEAVPQFWNSPTKMVWAVVETAWWGVEVVWHPSVLSTNMSSSICFSRMWFFFMGGLLS